ncbi:hypothetical protein ACWDBO_16640 [Streptomyces mirabilis]|uniref:hypothetical protein n=1 Tax=Streptomyces TaxID=1883 RepID=UPI0029B08E2B|nr:hypothetical protein [Streptomyces sp. AK02-04a]MDX3760779.1 hypothetical protein [Streptomyces sp. AK02-04a]
MRIDGTPGAHPVLVAPAWPRRAAGHRSDITENALREIFLPLGVVDVKVATLGEDWSGLKFVRRKELRTTWANAESAGKRGVREGDSG